MPDFLPYGRQTIEGDDVAAVVAALTSDWLTQGPQVEAFEQAFARRIGVRHAVAVNSGTAALHAVAAALRWGPGDEIIVPCLTFTATANCALFVGATPVFADVSDRTLTLDPDSVRRRLTPRTRAIIAMDYGGHPADYDTLNALAVERGLPLIADACHAPGATYRGRPVGTLAEASTFSFHPVKHIATGEGGMITTGNDLLAASMRDFRTHGITREASRFRGLGARPGDSLEEKGPWYYEMQSLGFNYRMPDVLCALGTSQLAKLDRFVARRRVIAARYQVGLAGIPLLETPDAAPGCEPAWHLYPVRVDFDRLGRSRTEVMHALKKRGIGTQVHYIPVHLQPYYRERFGHRPGLCPVAERVYPRLLSLPMYPALTDTDVDRVIENIQEVLCS